MPPALIDIGECKKMGLEVLPPDINESWRHFSVVPQKNQIRFGLLAIKNVGENIAEVVVDARKANGKFGSIDDFISRINSKDLNKKSLENLIKAGVFDKLEERNKLLFNLEKLLEINKEKNRNNNGQRGLFDGVKTDSKIKLEATAPATKNEKIFWQKKIVNRIRIGGIISKVKKIMTKTGKPMLFMSVEDLSDKIEVVVFPSVIENNPSALQENKIVFVSGRMDVRNDSPKLICESVEEIIET